MVRRLLKICLKMFKMSIRCLSVFLLVACSGNSPSSLTTIDPLKAISEHSNPTGTITSDNVTKLVNEFFYGEVAANIVDTFTRRIIFSSEFPECVTFKPGFGTIYDLGCIKLTYEGVNCQTSGTIFDTFDSQHEKYIFQSATFNCPNFFSYK